MKALISLRLSAGWSGPALSANCKRALFVHFSNEYPQDMFSWRNKKNAIILFWKKKRCLSWSYGKVLRGIMFVYSYMFFMFLKIMIESSNEIFIALDQGPVVQSFVSLTSSLRVISLTVLADSIYNILIFFAEKCEQLLHCFALQKLLTFFQQNFQHICASLDMNFNESLANNIISFEQLGPDVFISPKLLIFFLFLHENICCGYLLKVPRRGASNEYPKIMFTWRNKENIYLIPTLI